jgi:hypothetical protein
MKYDSSSSTVNVAAATVYKAAQLGLRWVKAMRAKARDEAMARAVKWNRKWYLRAWHFGVLLSLDELFLNYMVDQPEHWLGRPPRHAVIYADVKDDARRLKAAAELAAVDTGPQYMTLSTTDAHSVVSWLKLERKLCRPESDLSDTPEN